MTSASVLTMWTVYGPTTTDHPGKWVVRAFDIEQGRATPHAACTTHDSLLDARRAGVPPGLGCLMRSPTDDPTICETWF